MIQPNAKSLALLWLDDDAPQGPPLVINEVTVTTASSCESALATLLRAHFNSLVVDIVVPQEGWHVDRFYRLPGIEFIRYVVSNVANPPDITIYSIGITDIVAREGRAAGATRVYDKMHVTFADMLVELKRSVGF